MVRATSYDLVLLDIMMPEIDGYQVLSQMKADPALCDIPVIMISALDQINSVVRCIESGAEDYLSKPFDPVLLRAPASARVWKRSGCGTSRNASTPSSMLLSARLKPQRRRESESLLRNILPSQIAEELRGRGQVEPRYFEDVTILLSDFVGFTHATENLAAEDLVNLLHRYFTAFDKNCRQIRPGKTQDDRRQLPAGGRTARAKPLPPGGRGDGCLRDGQRGRRDVERGSALASAHRHPHTGPVIAGVVGIKKFAFDIWGESVNFSSRMESSGAANRINMSARTYSESEGFLRVRGSRPGGN